MVSKKPYKPRPRKTPQAAGIVPFLEQVLPGHFQQQLKERGLQKEPTDTTIANGKVVKKPSELVIRMFNRYGVSKATKAELGTFDYDMIVDEIQKDTGFTKEVILRAMTIDMHKLPIKYIERILSLLDEDFMNWFDAREFDDEYEG